MRTAHYAFVLITTTHLLSFSPLPATPPHHALAHKNTLYAGVSLATLGCIATCVLVHLQAKTRRALATCSYKQRKRYLTTLHTLQYATIGTVLLGSAGISLCIIRAVAHHLNEIIAQKQAVIDSIPGTQEEAGSTPATQLAGFNQQFELHKLQPSPPWTPMPHPGPPGSILHTPDTELTTATADLSWSCGTPSFVKNLRNQRDANPTAPHS